MRVLDNQIKYRSTDENWWNDHLNNCLCFSKVMEVYLTLCYSIKYGEAGFFQGAMPEVCIILKASSVNESKYARKMLQQLHIMDTTVFDLNLQQTFLANALINLQGQKHSFYQRNLLLKHQKREFK